MEPRIGNDAALTVAELLVPYLTAGRPIIEPEDRERVAAFGSAWYPDRYPEEQQTAAPAGPAPTPASDLIEGILGDKGAFATTEPSIFSKPPPEIERPEGQKPGLHHISVNSFAAENYADWEKEIAEAIADEQNQLNESFGDVIAKLRRDLTDLRNGRTDVNSAYASYQNAVKTVARQAVIDAPPLDPTEVVSAVSRSYDHAEGALNDALIAIDTSGNPNMAKAMNAELRFWEGSITRALSSKVDMQDVLHQSASDYARALAQSAYSTDAFAAESERARIEIQLLGTIREKQQQVADQRAAQARAQAKFDRARAEVGEEEWEPGDFEENRYRFLVESVMEMGFDEVQAVEMVDGFVNMLPAAQGGDDQGFIVGTESDWVPFHQAQINQQAMQMIRMPNGQTMWDLYQQGVERGLEYIDLGTNGDSRSVPPIEPDEVLVERGEHIIQTLQALQHNLDFRSGASIWDDVFADILATPDGFVQGLIQPHLPSTEDSFFSTRESLYRMWDDFGTQWSTTTGRFTG